MILYNDPCDDVGVSVSDWIKRINNGQKDKQTRHDSARSSRNNSLASYWGSLWIIEENSNLLKKRRSESS
jgi:hypothetical protein